MFNNEAQFWRKYSGAYDELIIFPETIYVHRNIIVDKGSWNVLEFTANLSEKNGTIFYFFLEEESMISKET